MTRFCGSYEIASIDLATPDLRWRIISAHVDPMQRTPDLFREELVRISATIDAEIPVMIGVDLNAEMFDNESRGMWDLIHMLVQSHLAADVLWN